MSHSPHLFSIGSLQKCLRTFFVVDYCLATVARRGGRDFGLVRTRVDNGVWLEGATGKPEVVGVHHWGQLAALQWAFHSLSQDVPYGPRLFVHYGVVLDAECQLLTVHDRIVNPGRTN